MRIEYWGRIRVKNGSYYVTIPRDEIYKLQKHAVLGMGEDAIKGQEVRVEVTL